jgi:hypothetical protein
MNQKPTLSPDSEDRLIAQTVSGLFEMQKSLTLSGLLINAAAQLAPPEQRTFRGRFGLNTAQQQRLVVQALGAWA